jgi:hypothetical protein
LEWRDERCAIIFATQVDLKVNLAMHKYSDLAPWILGGLSTAAVAIAITVGSNNWIAPKTLPAPSQTIAPVLPAPPALLESAPPAQVVAGQMAPATPAITEAITQPVTEPATQPAVQPEPGAQIWECTTNGIKTFSNNPCGEKSSLREVGPINTMEATPVLRRPRSFQPEPGYVQDFDYPGTQDYADNSYVAVVGVPIIQHRRGEGMHRPSHHNHRPAPGKN